MSSLTPGYQLSSSDEIQVCRWVEEIDYGLVNQMERQEPNGRRSLVISKSVPEVMVGCRTSDRRWQHLSRR